MKKSVPLLVVFIFLLVWTVLEKRNETVLGSLEKYWSGPEEDKAWGSL